MNLPHHCLETVSVAMHTGQLGLSIQGLPLLVITSSSRGTRHTSAEALKTAYKSGSLSVKRTNWRCSENSSELRLLGNFLKSNLMRTDDMLAKFLLRTTHTTPFLLCFATSFMVWPPPEETQLSCQYRCERHMSLRRHTAHPDSTNQLAILFHAHITN